MPEKTHKISHISHYSHLSLLTYCQRFRVRNIISCGCNKPDYCTPGHVNVKQSLYPEQTLAN